VQKAGPGIIERPCDTNPATRSCGYSGDFTIEVGWNLRECPDRQEQTKEKQQDATAAIFVHAAVVQ
jgi:hypothetical protein